MDKLLKQALSAYKVNEPGQELIDKIVDGTWGQRPPVPAKPWFVLNLRVAATLCALYCVIAIFAFEAGKADVQDRIDYPSSARVKQYRILDALLWGNSDFQRMLM